ncbi:MAG: energy transducer TonB [Pseudomonadota bacterium]
MRWIIFSIVLAGFMNSSALSQDSGTCDEKGVSRKIERQSKNWERESLRFGKAESVAKKVDRRLAKGDLEECDVRRVELALLRVKSRSFDSKTSIQALEQLIQVGELGVDGDPTGFVRNLANRYESSGQIDELILFASDHLDKVTGTDRSRLMNALLFGTAKKGDVEGAYIIAVDRIQEFPDAVSLASIQMLYAMSDRLGLDEHKLQYAEFASEKFGGLFLLGPLPLYEGDDLARILERRTNPDYELEVRTPPKPNYPDYAARKGLNGTCEVFFDVDQEGRPQNIQPFCSHAAFVEESSRAIKKMRYTPFEVEGVRYTVPGFIYPLEYTIG